MPTKLAPACAMHPQLVDHMDKLDKMMEEIKTLALEQQKTSAEISHTLAQHLEIHRVIETLNEKHQTKLDTMHEDEMRKLTAAVGSAVAIAVKETLVDTLAVVRPEQTWGKKLAFNILDKAIWVGLVGIGMIILSHAGLFVHAIP